MPVVTTQQNMVVAYEAGPDDLFVKVVWHGPGEDGDNHCPRFESPLWPIADYQRTVDWAVSMADQMRFPLHVVPRSGADVFKTEHIQNHLASLTDQERGELRRFVVSRLAEVMRDCDDATVRTEAFDLLNEMGVITK